MDEPCFLCPTCLWVWNVSHYYQIEYRHQGWLMTHDDRGLQIPEQALPMQEVCPLCQESHLTVLQRYGDAGYTWQWEKTDPSSQGVSQAMCGVYRADSTFTHPLDFLQKQQKVVSPASLPQWYRHCLYWLATTDEPADEETLSLQDKVRLGAMYPPHASMGEWRGSLYGDEMITIGSIFILTAWVIPEQEALNSRVLWRFCQRLAERALREMEQSKHGEQPLSNEEASL